MHISGVLLSFLAAILCGLALERAATVRKVRAERMEAYQKQEVLYEKQAKDLVAKERQLTAIKGELDRLMIPWGRYWSPVPAGVANPATGEVTANFGTAHGLKDKLAVQAFCRRPDGTFLYVGEFDVKKANEATSTLTPRWRVRPGETDLWPRGDWRFRSLIPAEHVARFTELEKELLIADTMLTQQTLEAQRQQSLIQLADEHLKLRVDEINGATELQGRELPPEFIKGYLTTLSEEEELRNGLEIEVARLRRELLETNQQIRDVLKQNSVLSRGLSQPRPAENAGLSRR